MTVDILMFVLLADEELKRHKKRHWSYELSDYCTECKLTVFLANAGKFIETKKKK